MTRNTRYGAAVIPIGAQYVTARVPTYNDRDKEDSSTITVELNDGLILNEFYTINHSRDTVAIVVADDTSEHKPTISVHRVGPASVGEGSNLQIPDLTDRTGEKPAGGQTERGGNRRNAWNLRRTRSMR